MNDLNLFDHFLKIKRKEYSLGRVKLPLGKPTMLLKIRLAFIPIGGSTNAIDNSIVWLRFNHCSRFRKYPMLKHFQNRKFSLIIQIKREFLNG